MTNLYVTDIPIHLQGELYNQLTTEFAEDDCPMNQRNIRHFRALKTDLNIRGLKDIIQIMDACMFFAVPLHWKVFDFVDAYPDLIHREMCEYEKILESPDKNTSKIGIEYGFFVTTEEYRALKILATFKRTWTWSDQGFLEYAIKQGSLVLIEYYAGRYCTKCKHIPLKWAIQYNQLPILAFLIKQPWVKLHSKMYSTSEETFAEHLCSETAVYNNLTILKYLRETLQFPWNKYVVQNSLCQDRLDVLRYALENGCPIPQYAMSMVIGMKSIDALRMFVEIVKTPLNNPDFTLWAAQNGQLSHLVYLHEHNTPWHPQAMHMAARYKHVDCVEFGISMGAPYEPEIVKTVYDAYDNSIDRWIGLHIYNAMH